MRPLAGRDLLLKVARDGVFVTTAGIRARALTLNARPVDITDSGSAGWRELLPDAGLRSAEITGSGIFRNADSDAHIRAAFFDQTALPCRFLMPGFGTLESDFLVTRLKFSGSFDGAAAFELAFQSAGPVTFAADT